MVLTAALSALGCGSTSDEHAASRAQDIAGGTEDASDQSVFLLVRESQNSSALCTATLIAPNLLLTARHCVSPGTGSELVLCGESMLGAPYPASAFFTTNDAEPHEGSQRFGAIDVRVPGVGVDTCGYDIALIILSENIPDSVSKPAVPRIDREVLPGEHYTAVGYGQTGTASMMGPTRMELSGLSIACEPGSCGGGVESTEFRGETGICSGDSGGPALDTDGKVVGVVSRGGPDCSTPIYGTVTAWRDFLIDTAKDAATMGGYTPPFWVSSGSSDPPVLAGSAGAPSVPEGASLGEPCTATSACQSDLVCYASESGQPGKCSATCTTTSQCSEGMVCQSAGDVSVCVTPSGGADDHGGCAVSRTRSSESLGSLLVALGASLTLVRRRSRRTSAKP